MDDDTEDYDVADGIRSLRRAGSKVIEGGVHLYHGGKDRIEDQHAVVQVTVTAGLWFAGNWVYNRITPVIVELLAYAIYSVPTESVLRLLFGLLTGDLALSTAQLLGLSTSVILGYNKLQTSKLTTIESNVIAMNKTDATATDGGRSRPEKLVSGPGLAGALAGASIGFSFGPGGVLAGIYLGYVVENRLAERYAPLEHVERE
jgi:hypothetical protein